MIYRETWKISPTKEPLFTHDHQSHYHHGRRGKIEISHNLSLYVVKMSAANQFVILFSFSEAFAEISGPRERFIKTGSELFLNCTFHRTTAPPAFIFWSVFSCELMLNALTYIHRYYTSLIETQILSL